MSKKLIYSIATGLVISAVSTFAVEEVGAAVAVVSAEEIEMARSRL